MKDCSIPTVAFSSSVSASGSTNAILFVTQVPIERDFTSIGSTFGNQQPTLASCGRGGDLCVRYTDGTIKNLTRAAGYGENGEISPPTALPSVSRACIGVVKKRYSAWSSARRSNSSIFPSSATGNYTKSTNFTDPNSVPVVTKVPNQPTNFNNVAPIYGTDDRIIFTSDRPRNGEAQLYPQLDVYEEAPTVTGLWSLQPTNGDLFMLNHTPSGAFSPLIDHFGRVVFVRWDHLQRDQQADTDWEKSNHGAALSTGR